LIKVVRAQLGIGYFAAFLSDYVHSDVSAVVINLLQAKSDLSVVDL
jgi:hypothetical protein